MISQDYVCDGQMSIFDLTQDVFAIRKPIRLIELFAGVGSQAMALRDLGADFEHHRVVEFDRFAIASYNAIHGTDFPTMDITQVSGEDLGITDTSKYCYIMTYSFPCQDLSVAGKQKGMTKGSGTRSGLLWEVERLLNEVEHLPQVLLMENVPQVHSKANMPDFQRWIEFLESKGYCNHWQDLNAKNYGVAQNRVRCFMVSILGDYKYEFPKPIPLTKTMKDYLEDEVDEKYYINNEKAQKLIDKLISDGTIPQSRAEQSRLASTSRLTSREESTSQTASQLEQTEESATIGQKEVVLCNYKKIEKVTDIARTICSRDYKGFGSSSQTQNGVIEWKSDK
jgi:DNA-cytosine methyltransferase